MPVREVVVEADVCDLSQRWGVDPAVMERVWLSAQDFTSETRRRVWIISGYRTQAKQAQLRKAGRPTAPDALSTHLTCPATGVDLSFGFGMTVTEKQIWGRILFMNGLRWGGNSRLDSNNIPLDWQHVDRGPR